MMVGKHGPWTYTIRQRFWLIYSEGSLASAMSEPKTGNAIYNSTHRVHAAMLTLFKLHVPKATSAGLCINCTQIQESQSPKKLRGMWPMYWKCTEGTWRAFASDLAQVIKLCRTKSSSPTGNLEVPDIHTHRFSQSPTHPANTWPRYISSSADHALWGSVQTFWYSPLFLRSFGGFLVRQLFFKSRGKTILKQHSAVALFVVFWQ